MDFVIAIDGPAASGKGTVASRLAAHYGLPYLDTGLLYRAVGYNASQPPYSEADAAMLAGRLAPDMLDNPGYRTAEASEAASRVAADPGVRAALLDFQRKFADQPGGAVLDGRDIGTVICPGAAVKLFVTAAPKVRAERRWKQMVGQGDTIAFDEVLADIKRRDARDSGRASAPLARAGDAVLLDTTEMDISAAFDAARRIVEQTRAELGLPGESQSHRV